MNHQEIFVPLLPWLIGGSRIGGRYNVYIGSRGTDPEKGCLTEKIFNYRIWIEKGCLTEKIFNYRIWIEKSDEQEFLKAAVYYGVTSYENQNEDDIIVKVFEMEQESLPLIKDWLESECKSYLGDE